MKKIVKDELETKYLANDFAKTLKGGEIILLNGDLGAGKTTFVSYVASALGVKDIVTSPTFTILKQYDSTNFIIKHFDMYRIFDELEASEFGMEEHLDINDNEILFIEWPERIKNILPENCIKINIKIIDEFSREFEFENIYF